MCSILSCVSVNIDEIYIYMLAVEIIIKIPNELVNVSIVNIARMLGGNFVFEIRKLHLPWHYKDAVFNFFYFATVSQIYSNGKRKINLILALRCSTIPFIGYVCLINLLVFICLKSDLKCPSYLESKPSYQT